MRSIKNKLFATPWHLIRFFIPFTVIVPLAVYYLTLFTHVYPGVSAFLTAASAGLCPSEDLSFPIFSLAARGVAGLPYADLPFRLNLFCAICGGLAVALFYLLTARLIFMFACEDPGGAMAAMPPQVRKGDDATDDAETSGRGGNDDFAMNADGTLSIPVSVQAHNRRVAHAAVLGGLGAAGVFAFSVPFWLVSTRLYPFAFDLMLFFLIVNLMISYDQRGNLLSLFFSVLLLGACCVESPLFLLLLPIGGIFLLRSMLLNGQATTYKMMFVVLFGMAGLVLALFFVRQAAEVCSLIPYLSPRLILRVFLETLKGEFIQWIPSFGWSYVFVQFLFPAAIAFFVFSQSFRRRTPLLFLMQLALILPLVPSLLNLSVAPWGIARLTSKIPVYQYVFIALFVGLMIAVWYLMREMAQEKNDEELDFYEYRDNPLVCRIGSVLCWPLLILVLLVPFRSFTDIDPEDGQFAEEVAKKIYRDLEGRDWLVNCRLLQPQLMILAHRDGRRLNFISADPLNETVASTRLIATISTDPAFESCRHRLVNAAELSTAAFLGEWFRHEPLAYRRIVLFDRPELWRVNGFSAVPNGLFLGGAPRTTKVDAAGLLARHHAFCDEIRPLVSPQTPDAIRYYAGIRKILRRQLALMANELGVLLVEQKLDEAAEELFKQTEALAPDNLSVVLNRYELAVNRAVRLDAQPEIESRLRLFQQREEMFVLTASALQGRDGTLLNPDSLEAVRKNLWGKTVTFRNLVVATTTFRADPLTVLRDKKRELVQSATRHIDANEFEEADRQLNLLLDLDDKDSFALVNKARIAIERRDLPEAGLWMDLAKESQVPADDLIWHEAALLILDGKTEDARARINKVIASRPGDIRLWGLLAEILMQKDEYAELENRVYPALRSAASKNGHYLMHMVRGYLLMHNGPQDYPLARACFLRALALNKHLGSIREDLLRLDDALDVPAFCEDDAKNVLRQNPEHAFANFLWGTVRLRRGELALAEDLFARSLQTETNAPAYAGMGAVLLERGDFKASETLLRRSLEMDPARLFTWHALARLLIATGRYDEAARALDTVLAGLPKDLDVRLTLIRLLMKQKKIEDAAVLVSNLLEDEELLPPPIRAQLKPLAAELTAALSGS